MEKGPCLRGDRRPEGTRLALGFTLARLIVGGIDGDVGGGDGREAVVGGPYLVTCQFVAA